MNVIVSQKVAPLSSTELLKADEGTEMKRYAITVVSLLGVVCMVSVMFAGIRRGSGMQVRFNSRDLRENGVHIITSSDPSFDEIAAKHFRNRSPESLKPFSVFLKNSGARLALAYALTWELRNTDGRIISSNTVVYSEPGILMGNEIPKDLKHTTAIEPGSVRCFSRDSQIEADAVETIGEQDTVRKSSEGKADASTDIRAMLAAELSHTTDVTVSLDGVVFDDGTFVGPNVTGFFEQMQALVNAKVDLLRDIAVASEQGTLDQAFDSIRAMSREPDIVFGENSSADNYYHHFRKLYATEITNKDNVYGKETLVPYLVKSYHRARPILRKLIGT